MGRLSTHVLDTMHGRPAAGMTIDLYELTGEARRLVKQITTNSDGRADAPLMTGEGFHAGRFELVFHVAPYFLAHGVVLPDPPFLDSVPIRFGMAQADGHYHVPLLVTPWGYSTYRGS